MLDVHALLKSSDLTHITGNEDGGLQQKLSLFQVFLRLYEQKRSLLDEILNLEHSIGDHLTQSSVIHYVQGIVLDDQVGVITNLMKGATQTIFQPQNVWTIGRDRRKSVIPIADTRLSRCHAAMIYCENTQEFQLLDFGSTNGSFVNGEQIRHNHLLRDGDRIRLGSLSFTFFTCRSIREANDVPEEILEQVSQHTNHTVSHNGQSNKSHVEIDAEASGTEQVSAENTKAGHPVDDTVMFLRS